ncbi:sugar MFS transporter [Thalassotalea sp. 1_MG-2023]|uniref:sugar MFS transporter n=1 Tax=Thalassotalea sp. 1_MG-2023 TaxID=3062680 RepID=UPI0026E478C1|nr:sugar MFS transporter [Thalassotalea sp. 1_MG-2023]MDO6426013.1 sugar MFS transporter [Thalassotalea sp. 1_MG-2023]
MAVQPAISSVANNDNEQYHFAFGAMTTLFFIWGFITALNDILIPYLKAAFDLNYTQAMLVQFCFFGAYFIISPVAGKLISKIGYLKGIITGLLTIATGCGIFYPAADIGAYWVFLTGLFVLASGITILQVSANPYVASLGKEATAASRLNLAQAINSLGHTAGPIFGSALIFGAVATTASSTDASAVKLPYLLIAGATILVAVAFKFLHLPTIKRISAEHAEPADVNRSIWQEKSLLLGVLAIFLYVGAEVSIGSFLVNYFMQSNIAAMSEKQAGDMVAYYWGAAMVGRFVGAYLTRFILPSYILAFNGVVAMALLAISMSSTGNVAMYSILAVGFFNSIMFPTIFTLAIRGLGPLTSKGSGLLCQGIVGGAILPLIQGYVADVSSVQSSFIVPALAYIYILFYALYSAKQSPRVGGAA